jgi:hypothetical protein
MAFLTQSAQKTESTRRLDTVLRFALMALKTANAGEDFSSRKVTKGAESRQRRASHAAGGQAAEKSFSRRDSQDRGVCRSAPMQAASSRVLTGHLAGMALPAEATLTLENLAGTNSSSVTSYTTVLT